MGTYLLVISHLMMSSPQNRYDSEQKAGPCGRADGVRTDRVTVFEPGQTITVVWDETVDHPSHYRISFDVDGHDDFVDPATMMEFNSNDAVLADNIPDDPSRHFEYQITLPDVECETCTLQVIQVMYDKPPYTIPGNDIYYNCADIALRQGAGADAGPMDPDAGVPGPDSGPGGTGDGRIDGGCSAAPQSGALAPMAALLALIALRRRGTCWHTRSRKAEGHSR
jgi:MYXO-CTERM domain-containing protein